jgi:glutaredoxin
LNKELVMYSRSYACPFVTTARQVLAQWQIPYREIYIDQDPAARENVLAWTGFLSVPTLIVAQPGDTLPLEAPQPLPKGASPRGIDRGAMITEPSARQFEDWLRKHGFIP